MKSARAWTSPRTASLPTTTDRSLPFPISSPAGPAGPHHRQPSLTGGRSSGPLPSPPPLRLATTITPPSQGWSPLPPQPHPPLAPRTHHRPATAPRQRPRPQRVRRARPGLGRLERVDLCVCQRVEPRGGRGVRLLPRRGHRHKRPRVEDVRVRAEPRAERAQPPLELARVAPQGVTTLTSTEAASTASGVSGISTLSPRK